MERINKESGEESVVLLKNIISMQIQTIDYCNRKCSWCPNSKIEKSPDNLMPMDLIQHILSELHKHNYKGRINPYLMAEPLCDKRIVDIVKMVREWFPDNEIGLNTNGDFFDYDLASRLLEAGVSQIRVNHYDDKELDEIQDKTFPQIFHRGLKKSMPTFYNRGGHVLLYPSEQQKICTWVFSKLFINWKGEVIICCSDYKYEVVFGNIKEKSLADIYNCPEYKMYRDYHLTNRGKELPLCNKCNRIGEI